MPQYVLLHLGRQSRAVPPVPGPDVASRPRRIWVGPIYYFALALDSSLRVQRLVSADEYDASYAGQTTWRSVGLGCSVPKLVSPLPHSRHRKAVNTANPSTHASSLLNVVLVVILRLRGHSWPAAGPRWRLHRRGGPAASNGGGTDVSHRAATC